MEETVIKRGIEPVMIRVGGAEVNGDKVVRVTINIFSRDGQTTSDIDLATASFVHAQELFLSLIHI
jgi:hypothetical protein